MVQKGFLIMYLWDRSCDCEICYHFQLSKCTLDLIEVPCQCMLLCTSPLENCALLKVHSTCNNHLGAFITFDLLCLGAKLRHKHQQQQGAYIHGFYLYLGMPYFYRVPKKTSLIYKQSIKVEEFLTSFS